MPKLISFFYAIFGTKEKFLYYVCFMKTPSNELFNLIKSLSGAEKSAFKLFSGQGANQAAYLKLFDAMDGLEEYDEKKMLFSFGKKNAINRIKDIKYNLQRALLRFLQYHYSDFSVEMELQGYLQITEILFQKRLFSSAEKYISKAEKKAAESHHYLYLLNILSWKRKIAVKQLNLTAFNEDEYKHYQRELHHIDLYKNTIEYQKISVRIRWILVTQSENPDQPTIAELQEILNNPFLQNEKMALSFPAKMEYCRILGNVYFLLGNWKKSIIYLQRATDYFEPAKVVPGERLMVLARLITVLAKVKRSDELLSIKNSAAKLIKSLPKKLQTINITVSYLAVMNNYIEHQLSMLNTHEALSVSDDILNLVEKHASTQSFLVFYSNRVELFLLTGNHRKALHCINKVFSVKKGEIRQDVIAHVKLLSLIVHYELGNNDLLQNRCKSYVQYFNKQKRQNKAEKTLLHFFHRNAGKQEKHKAFMALKKQLLLCKTDRALDNFDFISWVESKIQNRPMIEILKEKAIGK